MKLFLTFQYDHTIRGISNFDKQGAVTHAFSVIETSFDQNDAKLKIKMESFFFLGGGAAFWLDLFFSFSRASAAHYSHIVLLTIFCAKDRRKCSK